MFVTGKFWKQLFVSKYIYIEDYCAFKEGKELLLSTHTAFAEELSNRIKQHCPLNLAYAVVDVKHVEWQTDQEIETRYVFEVLLHG